jgi:hypothetical protein
VRIYKDEAVPATTKKVLHKLICDCCKAEAPRPYEDWATGGWDVNETEIALKPIIRHKEGKAYPETRFGQELTVDLCPACFTTKLIPFLRSIGVEVAYKDYHE